MNTKFLNKTLLNEDINSICSIAIVKYLNIQDLTLVMIVNSFVHSLFVS